MRHSVLGLGLAGLAASLVFAGPAYAGQVRAEVHTSGVFTGSDYKQAVGVGAGYDFTLTPGTFAGPDVSIDKVLGRRTRAALGIGARAGVNLPVIGRIYAVGGWASTAFRGGSSDWYYGGGYQRALTPDSYGKIEFRHYTASDGGLTPTRNAITLGVGIHF